MRGACACSAAPRACALSRAQRLRVVQPLPASTATGAARLCASSQALGGLLETGKASRLLPSRSKRGGNPTNPLGKAAPAQSLWRAPCWFFHPGGASRLVFYRAEAARTAAPNMLEKRRRLRSRRIARCGLAGDARERALV